MDTQASHTIKTDGPDITEILLKVALKTNPLKRLIQPLRMYLPIFKSQQLNVLSIAYHYVLFLECKNQREIRSHRCIIANRKYLYLITLEAVFILNITYLIRGNVLTFRSISVYNISYLYVKIVVEYNICLTRFA